ncbi:MAG: right-handed parallel beta-helix repeat-containing protein, partial [Acidimicrobiales bacterium]
MASAIAASHDGDTIQVQAGTYTNDTAKITTSITLQAVGGRVLMQETAPLANQKGILIVGTQSAAPTVSIAGFDFAGASTPFGRNGAGIRYQNGNLTLTNDYFHNNQNGILATPWQPGTGTLLIDHSEFAHNGTGDGYTHNIYVGDIDSFTLQNSYSHDTAEGHEVKSRAENTIITNNRIFDNDSTSSYSIDLPNGGNATITGNLIEQGAHGHNPVMIAYGEERGPRTGTNFTVAGNTFVNDLRSVTAVWNRGIGTANLANNQFFGVPPGKVVSGANTETGSTFVNTRPVLDTATHPFSVGGSA